MNKFASFGLLLVFFVMLSMVVVFGFFFFTPKLKTYRALNIEVENTSQALQREITSDGRQEKTFTKLEKQTAEIKQALKQQFEPDVFKAFLGRYFKDVVIKSIESEVENAYNIDTVEIVANIESPAVYYRFVEALNTFEWAVEIGQTQEFIGADEGIDMQLVLKVYTYK